MHKYKPLRPDPSENTKFQSIDHINQVLQLLQLSSFMLIREKYSKSRKCLSRAYAQCGQMEPRGRIKNGVFGPVSFTERKNTANPENFVNFLNDFWVRLR